LEEKEKMIYSFQTVKLAGMLMKMLQLAGACVNALT